MSGSAFSISPEGLLVTNSHVISSCVSPIKARLEGSSSQYYIVEIITDDPSKDLAALQLNKLFDQGHEQPLKTIAYSTLRGRPSIKQGEKAAAYGFPLRGLLAATGNLTVGYVSALSGLRDDERYIQITTPVQPGNSGGPLLDGSGHIIGVVVAKLDARKLMLATGDIPQNVNFAVSATYKPMQSNSEVEIISKKPRRQNDP